MIYQVTAILVDSITQNAPIFGHAGHEAKGLLLFSAHREVCIVWYPGHAEKK